MFLGSGSGHVVRDNYIHYAIPYDPIADPHIDGIQLWAGGVDNVLIEHNTVIVDSEGVNAAITGGLQNNNVTVNNNLFSGGGYTMYAPGAGSVTNNRFGTHVYGYYTPNGVGGTITFSGNVDDVTGAPILEP